MRTVLAFAILLLCASTQVIAEESTPLRLSDLKAQGATQLSTDELQALLPGAKVKSVNMKGSTRMWENAADGSLIASSDNRGLLSAKKISTAHGSWQLGNNGTYCVFLEWPSTTEQWCRFIFKAGDKYYGVKSAADLSSVAFQLELSH